MRCRRLVGSLCHSSLVGRFVGSLVRWSVGPLVRWSVGPLDVASVAGWVLGRVLGQVDALVGRLWVGGWMFLHGSCSDVVHVTCDVRELAQNSSEPSSVI